MELKIDRLRKTYPNGVHALRDVSLTIVPGMFGLLGPNGAGKSTLMRILATLQEADGGAVTLGDIDVLRDKESVRRTLGYLPQEFGLYPKSTAAELLDHFALLKGVVSARERRETVRSLLEQTNLWDARDQRLGGFSGGMRQRFGIAVALIGNPRLIIVDEPTAGLDPAERVRFLNLLSALGENAVVLLSTHIVEDVSDLCQRMAVIQGGRILLEAVPAEAVRALHGRVWRREVPRDELAAFEQAHQVISTTLLGGETVVHVVADAAPDGTFQRVQPDLKDVYFTLMRGLSLHREQSAPVELHVAPPSAEFERIAPHTPAAAPAPLAADAAADPWAAFRRRPEDDAPRMADSAPIVDAAPPVASPAPHADAAPQRDDAAPVIDPAPVIDSAPQIDPAPTRESAPQAQPGAADVRASIHPPATGNSPSTIPPRMDEDRAAVHPPRVADDQNPPASGMVPPMIDEDRAAVHPPRDDQDPPAPGMAAPRMDEDRAAVHPPRVADDQNPLAPGMVPLMIDEDRAAVHPPRDDQNPPAPRTESAPELPFFPPVDRSVIHPHSPDNPARRGDEGAE